MPPQPVTFITGATGFVGAAVARKLLAEGHRLRALARPSSNRGNLEGLADIELVEGDLTRPQSYSNALNDCTALFHVAADYRLWVPDPAAMHMINVEGTHALMKAALRARIERIVYTSSVAALGIVPGGDADEATPVEFGNMVGIYKQSKYRAEEAVRRLIADENLPAVIVNPSTPIGPRDIKPTPTGRIIVDAAKGRIPAYVDTGLNIAHVDDVADGHWLAYQKGRIGQRYILGGENKDLSDILAIVARQVGREPPTVKLPRAALYPVAVAAELLARFNRKDPIVTVDALRMAKKKMFFTSQKAERELGYNPRPAEDAIADAIAWFREKNYC